MDTKMIKKYFHEEWAKEEEALKISLEVSRRNKIERTEMRRQKKAALIIEQADRGKENDL